MNTLYGPHMMQIPTAFVPQLRLWQPPVCLLLLDVLHNLELSDSDTRLAALAHMTVTELAGHIQTTIRSHVQPFRTHTELHATRVIDSSPQPGGRPRTLKLEVHPDGTIYYVDEGVRSVGYLQYNVVGSWPLTKDN